ncbi:toll-like receptor 6 isoform X2 [Anopheles stephensi]|uniref:toll-like receptor 6 isoform X2 n=1 Tax=Anopheles stephensi TaxID=30069 RepID=UPI001658A8FB|nr:toll-like receptor 6 isoform X2 [Anopheles stephensi]
MVCLVAATAILVTSAKALKFYCTPDEVKCVIEDWNPVVDGYSLFEHIPNVTRSIHLINLQHVIFGSKLCHTIARFVDDLVVYDSPKVQLVRIPGTCNVVLVTMQNTGALFFDFKPNDSITGVLVKNARLSIISITLGDLPSLEYIILEATDIQAMEVSLFCPFRCLKLVRVSHGKLNTISGTGTNVHQCSLESLKLHHNSLTAVNLNLFAPFTSLTLFDLSHNKIEVLSGRLTSPFLTSLLLNNNRLKVLNLCPWNVVRHLNVFSIAHNNITRMPPCLDRFPNVTHLSMQFNQIDTMEVEQLARLPNLTSINLSFNNIATIPVDEHLYPQNLKQIDLGGNLIKNDTVPVRLIGNIVVAL